MEVAILNNTESGSNDSLPVQDKDKIKKKKTKKRVKFSYFEPTVGIIIAVVFVIIFLVFPQIITYVFIGDRLIPTFDAAVIQSTLIIVFSLLWALIRIGIQVSYFIERSFTKRLALITIIGNVLATICGIVIFISPRIVFWEYSDFVHKYFEDMAAWFSVPLTGILDRPNLIILVIMIVVFIVESVNMVKNSNKVKGKKEEDSFSETGKA